MAQGDPEGKGQIAFVAPGADAADAAGAERVVIEDVHLIGRKDASGDLRVTVLIVGGKLDVVTQSDLVKRPDDMALNAGGGFLMGQLAIGERPSFVIIDRDPREHFEVLLDTYLSFGFSCVNIT
jgi:hypothetical protein